MPTTEELEQQIKDLQALVLVTQTPRTVNGATPAQFSTNAVGGLPESKHLEGNKNYQDWKFWMKNYLVDGGLWNCVSPKQGVTPDPDLDQRALAKINLSVKSTVATELRKCSTSAEAWKKLSDTYEDSGTVRLVGLYQEIFKTRFENFKTMKDYINHFLNVGEQLENIQKPLDNEVLGALILAGLPASYKPLILGLQGAKQKTTIEVVKNLLIQDNMENFAAEGSYEEHALLVNRSHKNKSKGKGLRCYRCNGYGHVQKDCPTEDSDTNDEDDEVEETQQPKRKSKSIGQANLVILGRGEETY